MRSFATEGNQRVQGRTLSGDIDGPDFRHDCAARYNRGYIARAIVKRQLQVKEERLAIDIWLRYISKNITSETVSCGVIWESLVEDFELFFADLPPNVQHDLLFMMVVLSDESLVVRDPTDVYENAGRGLFKANSRMGRIGNLVNAVSVLDVYFAMDVHNRFDADKGRPRGRPNGKTFVGPYAREIGAIQTAKRRWLEARATRFTPAAIAAALVPPTSSRKGARRSVQPPQVINVAKPSMV